jgi:hypothetical protein
MTIPKRARWFQMPSCPPRSDHREAEDLLSDFASALRALPEIAWLRAVGKLPAELFERLERWMEARLA